MTTTSGGDGSAALPDDVDGVGKLGCPQCGEQNPDDLVLDEDDRVACQTCGNVYSLAGGDRS